MKRLVVVTTASMLASFALGAFTVQRINAQSKPPVYFVVENEISDVQGYLKEYAVHARDMIKANGGRYLAAGDATTYVGERPNLVWPYSSLTTSSKYKLATKLSEPWAKSTPNSATTPSQEFHSRVTTIEDMIHFPLPG